MDATEDIKKCIAAAQSLPLEAKSLSEIEETEKDVSLQQMEALLASNCQKLCIEPSSHFYIPENSPDYLKEKLNKMKEPHIEASDYDEEYETVIYNGPDKSYELVDEKHSSPNKDIPHVKLKLMNARLAQASAEYGGLLSPHFFLQSPGVSSTDSSRHGGSSSEIIPDKKLSGTNDISSSQSDGCSNTPFTFPNHSPTEDSKSISTDNVASKLERAEILDEDPSEEKEKEWVEWPKKYIESKGYSLGVQPGNFYKDEFRPCFYVKLPHLSNFEIIATNNNQIPCDLDLYVNGEPAAALRLPAGTTRSIDGPQHSKNAFKLFRAKDAPPDKVTEGARQNGVVKAVFTPRKIESSRLRSVSDPLHSVSPVNDLLTMLHNPEIVTKRRSVTVDACDRDKAVRSLDLSQVTEGVTLLQGRKKNKKYVLAPEMETDPSKRVILQLRLIASLDEEIDAVDEEIYDLEPPPLPTGK